MRRRNLHGFVIAICLMLAATAAAADLRVEDARLRLLPGDLPGAGYFELENDGDRPVVLSGAHSPAFAHISLHKSSVSNGQAHMASVSRLTLAAGEHLSFAPGGYHLMFMQRQRPLAVGDTFEVTLEFDDGQTLTVTFHAVSATSS